MIVDPAWILSLMTELEPSATYRETYPKTAAAIARASEKAPLPGMDATRTASLLVSVAWFESRFQPDARGDSSRAFNPTHAAIARRTGRSSRARPRVRCRIRFARCR